MPTRVISREERDRAIKEAEAIIRLGKTWQRLEPNERRPNFEAAAAALLRQTLGSKVDSGRRRKLDIKEGGLQHQHSEREARLIERTLKNGMYPQSVLHSFQTGSVQRKPEKIPIGNRNTEDLPDFSVHILDRTHDLHAPGRYNVRARTYEGHMHDMHPGNLHVRLQPAAMPEIKVPGGTEHLV